MYYNPYAAYDRLKKIYAICPKCKQRVEKVYYNGAYRLENHNTQDDSDICHNSGTALSKVEEGFK
jgi:hypothetical protein